MRKFIAALALSFAALTAHAQEVLAPDPGIEAVIAGQFDAFRAGEVNEAWTYASPNIQSLFGSVENFARMVEQGYPMVWQPGTVDFIDLQSFGGLLVQRVQVIDAEGRVHYLGYQMVETAEGWRINGVQLLPAPDVAA
ncbi:DUF4864 domain-containing protein [Roseicyclus marinus]|nr:DUF4864 domain-containing protein [Roseicyclus marinus]MDG3041830.1 DUF4864 domain-containing protein [Roseicyclus marinus]